MRKKILIISTVYPYPSDTGKKVVLSGILSYLADRFGAENVVYVLLGHSAEGASNSAGSIGTVIHIPKPGLLAQAINIIRFTLFGRTKSIQESVLFSRRACKKLAMIISSHEPEVILYDTVRTGQFREHLRTHSMMGTFNILYMEDLFSVRYQKMIETMSRYPGIAMDPLGNFRIFLPPFLSSIVQLRSLQKLLLEWEKHTITASEDRWPKLFDVSLLLNAQEVLDLRARSGASSIRQIKPLLARAGADTAERDYRGNAEFIFLGSLSYPQNQIAIEYFITTNMDRIIELMPSVMLRIIGRGASTRLLLLAERYPGHISVDGYIDDIGAVFSRSCAMIVPLLFGSGIKLKTLEAFSYGLPVICTDFGVEGITATNGIHCVIENDIGRFPDHMVSLCDMKVNRVMSDSCRKFFHTNYSRDSVTKDYDYIFSSFNQ